MHEELVECVPNFAEGREADVILAILNAMRLPQVRLLDYVIDAARHRSVVTIAGPPTAVCEAVVRAAGIAALRIDLTQQTGSAQAGAHPRIGATDVIPFVPIANGPLLPCILLARETAAALWERYHLPSYLYEAAASRPDRFLLDEVRRGQFEGLKEALLRDPSRRPDSGGPGLHPTAGAVAVGARRVLIEYSLTLDSGDLAAARAIARAVRAESSGLEGVRALALLAKGQAQVALAIADYRQTSLGRVFEAAMRAARKQRVKVLHGSLVGLIPEAAYEADSDWVRLLRGFEPDQHILDRRLAHPLAWPERI